MSEILVPPAPASNPTPAQRRATEILDIIYESTTWLTNTQASAYSAIWYSSDATPQEIFDALGVDGERTLLWHQDLVNHILGVHNGRPLAAMEESEYRAPSDYNVESDGTVTVIVQ